MQYDKHSRLPATRAAVSSSHLSSPTARPWLRGQHSAAANSAHSTGQHRWRPKDAPLHHAASSDDSASLKSGRERRRDGKQKMLQRIAALQATSAQQQEQLELLHAIIDELQVRQTSPAQRVDQSLVFDLYDYDACDASTQTEATGFGSTSSPSSFQTLPSPPSPSSLTTSLRLHTTPAVQHPAHHLQTVVMGEGPPTGPPPMASRRCDAFGILHMPTTPPRDTDSLTQPTPPPTALARVTSPTTSTATPAIHHSSTPLPSPSFLAPSSPTSFPAFLPISTTHTDTDSILHDYDLHAPPHTALAQGLTTHKRDDGTTTQHHTPQAQPLHTSHTSPTDTHSTDDSSLCCPSSSPFPPQRLPAWTSFPSATGLSDSPTSPPTSTPTHPILYIPDANIHLVPQTWVSQRLHRALALLTTSSFLTCLYVSASLRPRPSFSHTAATPARPSAVTPAGVTNTPSLTSPSTTPSSFSPSRLQDVKLVSSSPHSPLPSCTNQSELPTARPAATPAAPPAHNQPRGDGDVLRYDYSVTTASHEARFTERGPPVTANIFGAGNDSAGSMSYSQQFLPLDDTDLFLQHINRHCDDLLEQVPVGDSYAGSFTADDDDDDAGDFLAATATGGPPHAQLCGPLPQAFTFSPGAEAFAPGYTELQPPATSDSMVVSIAGSLAHDEADAVLAALDVPACDRETQASTAFSASIGQDSVPSCSRQPWFMPQLGQESLFGTTDGRQGTLDYAHAAHVDAEGTEEPRSALQSEDVQLQECSSLGLPFAQSSLLDVAQMSTPATLAEPLLAHLLRILHHLATAQGTHTDVMVLHGIFLSQTRASRNIEELDQAITQLAKQFSNKLESILARAAAEGQLVHL